MIFNYSFIIPHKNCPELLQRCVNSIPEREDVQVVVVDDNSDELKKPALKKRKNMQVVLLDPTQSNGAGRARNVGIEHATGKWLLFADADDYYNNGFLDILDKYKDESKDVLYFNFIYKDGKNGQELSYPNTQKYFKEYDGSKAAQDQIRYHHKFPWTKMVSKAFIKENGIHFEETPNGNDIFFSMSVGYFAKEISVVKEALYVYLKNENSLVNSKNKPFSSHLCKITHSIQLNCFYNFIGHPEWKTRFARILLNHIEECGIKIVVPLLLKGPVIWKRRNEWVEFFRNAERHN